MLNALPITNPCVCILSLPQANIVQLNLLNDNQLFLSFLIIIKLIDYIIYIKIKGGAVAGMKKIGSAIAEYFRVTDRLLILLWPFASALSAVYLYGLYHAGLISSNSQMKTQIVASCIGLLGAVIISLIDYHFLLKLWKLYMPLCVALVALAMFTSLGKVRGDNQAWLIIPIGNGISLQASEFLKLSFITTMSIHIAKVREHINRLSTVALLLAHGMAHVLLIQWTGDSGTALVFVFIFVIMIFCAGIGWRYVIAALAAMAGIIPLLWFKIMSLDQKMRILVLLNPSLDKDYSLQQQRGLSALGYGGMEGTGIFNADRYIYVPEAYNDFIFTFIGGTTGFIGALGIIVLLLVISFKVFHGATHAVDDQGKFICIGVFAMIITQTIINLGMCLSVLPVIGVTLPLFSAGGSSVLSMYTALGLVLSVHRHSNSTLFYSD